MRRSWLVVALVAVGLVLVAWRLIDDKPGGSTYSLQETRTCLTNAGFQVSTFLERSKGGAGHGPVDWLYVNRRRQGEYVDIAFALSPKAAHEANRFGSEPVGIRRGSVILSGLGRADRKVLDCLRKV